MISRLFKRKPKQSTWVYCPGCKKDLVSSKNALLSDTDRVRYYCLDCYTVSEWDFDFPAPLHLDSYYQDPNDAFKLFREKS